jgi:hypothetical protein
LLVFAISGPRKSSSVQPDINSLLAVDAATAAVACLPA